MQELIIFFCLTRSELSKWSKVSPMFPKLIIVLVLVKEQNFKLKLNNMLLIFLILKRALPDTNRKILIKSKVPFARQKNWIKK